MTPNRKDHLVFSDSPDRGLWIPTLTSEDVERTIIEREALYEEGARPARDFHFRFKRETGVRANPNDPDYLWRPELFIEDKEEAKEYVMAFTSAAWHRFRKNFGVTRHFERARVRGRDIGMRTYQETMKGLIRGEPEPRTFLLYKDKPFPCPQCKGAGTLEDKRCPTCKGGKTLCRDYTIRALLREIDPEHATERFVWEILEPVLKRRQWSPESVRFADAGISFQFSNPHPDTDWTLQTTSYMGRFPVIRSCAHLQFPKYRIRATGSVRNAARLRRGDVEEALLSSLDWAESNRSYYHRHAETIDDPWNDFDILTVLQRETKKRGLPLSIRTRLSKKVASKALKQGSYTRRLVCETAYAMATKEEHVRHSNSLAKLCEIFHVGGFTETKGVDRDDALRIVSGLDRDKKPIDRGEEVSASYTKAVMARDPRETRDQIEFDPSGKVKAVLPGIHWTPSGQSSSSEGVEGGSS